MRNSRPLYAGPALLAAAAVLLGSAGLAAQSAAQHDTISSQADFLTRLERVELGRDGVFWIGLSGHVRVRTEGWDSFGFGAPAGADHEDVFTLTRFLLNTELHMGSRVQVTLKGKSAHASGRTLPGGRRVIDADEFELHNGYVDVSQSLGSETRVTARAGRMDLPFGKERLVSPLPWANSLRAFEGFAGIAKRGRWTTTGFRVHPVQVRPFKSNQRVSDITFYGVYADGTLARSGTRVNLYWLGLDRETSAFNGTSGHENRHTLGGLVSGRASRFDYEVEAAYQFGTLGEGDIAAYMIASQFGVQAPVSLPIRRLFVGFDRASGDHVPGGDVQTFNQLFPLGHAYLGFIDAVGRQNVTDVSLGVDTKPFRGITVAVAEHNFWLADTDDALYNAGAGVVRQGAGGSSGYVGSEVDVTVSRSLTNRLGLTVGYSRFFSGRHLEQTGPSEDIDFLYVSTLFTF